MSPLEKSKAIASDRSVAPAQMSAVITKWMPGMVSAIAVLSASSALALPSDPASVYGQGMVLQSPDHISLPDGVKLSGAEFTIDRDRFVGLESLDRSKLTITSWKTELPVTMPNGQAAVATFYGSPERPMTTPGAAVQRGFTLPEERITFSTDPKTLRNSGLNGIRPGDAFTGPNDAKLNPTEFGTAYTHGGMTTSANWMVVRDHEGKVLFEGTPATYAAQLYWDGKIAIISDAEGLALGEGNYRKTYEHATETTQESASDRRLRQAVAETDHTLQGRNTWDVTDVQQRIELTTKTQPFKTEEVTQAKQTFTSDLASIFPLQNVAVLHRDPKAPSGFKLRTNFQLSGDVTNESNPTLSGQLRIPLDTKTGTSSLNLAIGGAPRNNQPGQPNFYALLYAQINTPLLRVEHGQYKPSPFVAGVRFGGGVFHAPVAAKIITQKITQSGIDIVSERRVMNDFTTTTWGQDFTTHFTQQITNDFVDTYRIDTTQTTATHKTTQDVVVTRPDGTQFVAPDYRQVSIQRVQTISHSAAALTNSELVASSTTIQPGKTEFSDAFVLNQQTATQLVDASTASQRVVQDTSVTQTVSNQSAWGTLLFINPYFGNFDLAAVKKPGSFLYEVGGTFVRSSLLGTVSYKDTNIYVNVGVPLWNPAASGKAGNGLLTLRAHATYFPLNQEFRAGIGLQLSGF